MSRWKPELDGEYYFINSVGNPGRLYWGNDSGDRTLYNMGNCFATAEEAEEVARTWKRLLNEYHENKKLNWSSSSKLMEMCTDALKNIGGLSDNSETAELPKWCKVGAWVYVSNNGYHKITCIETNGYSVPLIILDDGSKYTFGSLSWDDVSQARLRPYNSEEMKSLGGKTEKMRNHEFVFSLYNGDLNIVWFNNYKDSSCDSLNDKITIDGERCCVLEHLNDNGEWVK